MTITEAAADLTCTDLSDALAALVAATNELADVRVARSLHGVTREAVARLAAHDSEFRSYFVLEGSLDVSVR